VKAGLPIVDFPSNQKGHILHRGRSAVAAAATFTPLRAYGIVPPTAPSFMGVPGGERIWDEIESRHASRLAPDAESELVASLARSFERLGGAADRLS
jgi:hypothetical protein